MQKIPFSWTTILTFVPGEEAHGPPYKGPSSAVRILNHFSKNLYPAQELFITVLTINSNIRICKRILDRDGFSAYSPNRRAITWVSEQVGILFKLFVLGYSCDSHVKLGGALELPL